jgi:protein-disulfide isomerase/uncharacterized membrane protein
VSARAPKNSLQAHLRGYYLQLASAVAGAAASLYLASQHTRLKSGIQEGPSFCSLGSGFDCDTVSSSQYSEIGGISLGFIGWAAFSFFIVLTVIFGPGHKAHARVRRLLAWVVAIALAADVALLGVQLLIIKNVCLVCLFTYLANIGIFTGLLWQTCVDNQIHWKESLRILFFQKRGARFGGSSLAVSFILMGGLLAGGWVAVEQAKKTETGAESPAVSTDLPTFKEVWQTTPRKDVPIRASDATKGSPKAKVQIVVFSDFECPHCKRAAFALGNAIEAMGDRVRMAYKHFPLSSECNPELDRPMHPNACMLAHLSYCANKKGNFWPFHDKVYFEFSEADIRAPAAEVKEKLKSFLSKEEIDRCLEDPATLANTREDIQLGQKLQLKGTPAIFINGKIFTMPLTPENLRTAVDWESGI